MHRVYYERKLTGRRRLRDLPYIKAKDIFKPLRRQRIRRDVSHRPTLTLSRRCPPPFADRDSLPIQPLSSDHSTSSSSSPHMSRYSSDAINLSSATEEDCSSGMSTSISSFQDTFFDVERPGHDSSLRPVPVFTSSPLKFRLRSASTSDFLVERLEQRLHRLSLGSSPDHVTNLSRDVSMASPIASDRETSLHCALSCWDTQKPPPSPRGQNAIPTIFITSVDAKHAKPLPASSPRPSRTPFDPSNHVNHPTNIPSAKYERKTISDDPFAAEPYDAAHLLDNNLTFRLPSFPSACTSPSEYAPETPTPMCCDHFGDCRGDFWEILHPPLIPGTLALPPFKLPPLSTSFFDDMSTPLSY